MMSTRIRTPERHTFAWILGAAALAGAFLAAASVFPAMRRYLRMRRM